MTVVTPGYVGLWMELTGVPYTLSCVQQLYFIGLYGSTQQKSYAGGQIYGMNSQATGR
ncbi:MAG: hypothetical protein MAGBODY4_01101 [Candidatus Marinimicrobia bacterium]|nr:hypothetical protein [Candidatus Neomarinimicrobiota bacterium]